MKLTMNEVREKLEAAWGTDVFVVPYRIAGNRYVYTATDHGEHRLRLKTSWVGLHQVFEPRDADKPTTWAML